MSATAAIYRGYSRAALDDQYDNSKAVGAEAGRFLESYARRSEAARRDLACFPDVAYGAAAGEKLDFFPTAEPAAPVLIFIHGGYWRALDKDRFRYLARDWVLGGVNFAAVNYTLAPAATMDEIVRQNRAAVAWLARHAADFGADAGRLFIAGHSAGGHLTAMMLSTDWARFDPGMPADAIVGGCAISGIYDLEPIRLCYLNDEVRLDAEMATRNSPLHNLPTAAPPLMVTVGGLETDEFRRQQSAFVARWRQAGLPLEVVDAPQRHHFSIVDDLGDASSPLFQAVRRRLARSV